MIEGQEQTIKLTPNRLVPKSSDQLQQYPKNHAFKKMKSVNLATLKI